MSRRVGWLRASIVAMAVDTVGVLPVFMTGALAVQLRQEIGLSLDSLGLVYASYFASAALFSAPLGHLSERVGPERTLRAGVAVYVVAFIGISTLVDRPLLLSAFIALSGFGTALTRTASSVLVARNVDPGRQGFAFGLKHSSIPVGSIIAGLSVPAIALTVGWRWAYATAAALSAAVFVAIPRTDAEPDAAPASRGTDMSLGTLILAAGSFALGSSAAASLGAYTVSTAVAAGLSEGSAGLLVAVGSVVGLTSRLAIGHWSDQRYGSQLDLVTWMLAFGGVGFMLLGTAQGAAMWLAVPVAFATGWAWLGSYNLAMVRLNPIAPGSAVGITQTGAFVGAIIGPASLGFLAERFSFTVAWTTAAIASALAATMIFVLRRFILREPTARQLRMRDDAGRASVDRTAGRRAS
ncbi:MAG TPA: MFS transporter [Actinomycetota bacterium]|nr:MFS transporter [Actinomycetota bacterium]